MIQVELLAREGNIAVLRMPDRKFPGIFVQGDTMATLRDLLEGGEGSEQLSDQLGEARDRLVELLQFYEAALKANGIAVPY
ncbi:hypothetical protein [Micromonospora sp. NPDC050495]|uniref:DUF6959 family protein n=1 Tax=Micromonospora sp. NPDC050495 TaxID=3154936 RepID=UPI0033F2ADBF